MKLPIRVRLTAVYCMVFCGSTLLLEFGTYWGINAAIYAIVDNDLQSREKGVEGFLDEHIARRTLPRLREELWNHEALQPAHLAVFDAGDAVVFQGSAFQGSAIAGASHTRLATGAIAFRTAEGQSESLRLMAARRRIQGHEYVLLLATGLAVPFSIMRAARSWLLLSAPLVLLLASLAGYWVSGRALAPVSELTRAARTIGATSLSSRVKVPHSGDELEELAVTLNQMLARIDDAFRHVAQFTANASHELRTPLALIRTTSEVALLRSTGNAATYRDALHRILGEAERNTALLDNLLLLARADSGERILNRHAMNLAVEMEEICEQIQLLAAEKNLRLRVDNDMDTRSNGAWISADSDHLRRLWLILLDNAIKYTARGGEIRVSVIHSGPNNVAVEVMDSGIGIAEKDLPHLFERFFRADEARTKLAGGTGLGLSIARSIADAHEATIVVRSQVGEGSTFRVVFPRSSPARQPHSADTNSALVTV